MSGAAVDRARAALDARLAPRAADEGLAVLGAGTDLAAAVDAGRAYLRALTDGGWAVPSWPVAYGGAGLEGDELEAVRELLEAYERPDLYLFEIGLSMAGPMIIRYGTDAQRARYLEPIRTGAEIWCQLFSEPEAGSDLAALRTRARRDGDGWVVSGHKLWVSRAALARFGLLLARTDPAAPRHAGITAFVLPMDAPGIARAPIRQMNGDEHFEEVFLDDVRLSDEQRLGPEGDGWRIAMSTLAEERGAAARGGVSPAAVVALLRDSGRAADPVARQAAAAVIVRLLLPAIGREEGRTDGAKILFAEAMRELAAFARSVRGPAALVDEGPWSLLELTAPSLSIRGGTDEIQLNVIAERVLGLPREPGGR